MSAGFEHIREERVDQLLPPPTEVPAPPAPPAYVAPAVAPVGATTVRTARSFAPDSVVAAIVGLALLVVGILAMIRAGLDSPLNAPVVKVLGANHTAVLGIVEAVAGLLLVAAAAARSRGASLFVGTVLGVGAFIGIVQTSSFRREFALERNWAWVLLIAGAVVVLAALLMPRFYRQSTVVTPE